MLLLFRYKKSRSITDTDGNKIPPCDKECHNHENGSECNADDRANLFHKNTLIVITTTFCVLKCRLIVYFSQKITEFLYIIRYIDYICNTFVITTQQM